MAGRRRGAREPAFGSDSFLDVIANLVGIVLIIIVMVGAQVRHLPMPVLATNTTAPTTPVEASTEERALEQHIQTHQREIADLQERLLKTLRSLEAARAEQAALQEQRQQFKGKLSATDAELRALETRSANQTQALASFQDDQRSLRQRLNELQRIVEELEKQKPERRMLRYHLPISQLVGPHELMFECRQGRVTFADVKALLDLVRDRYQVKAEDLKDRWELTEQVGPIGAFRLEYTVARERATPLDRAFGSLPPAEDRYYSYGVARWELVPAWEQRGESLDAALADGSAFRQVIDHVNPNRVALTFFVYPQSFELFRRLRDHLYERGFVVAGRPLPPDQPIAGSRQGSISRGQ